MRKLTSRIGLNSAKFACSTPRGRLGYYPIT
nr:MAG TPA: hypothetical protein [Caudoviricetes sp.]DAU66028.1 MAG TPA: hypothetical protein [Bacteriophage sp.]